MTIQELLRTLPELSANDLEKVRQRVVFLSRSSGASASPRSQVEDWLADGFSVELRRRGLMANGRYPSVLPKNWEAKSATVREFLLKGFPRVPAHAEKLALAEVSARQLADYLLAANLRLSPRLLFANVEKVPQALDAAFPGYWRSQLLHFCIGRGVS